MTIKCECPICHTELEIEILDLKVHSELDNQEAARAKRGDKE